MEYLNNISRWWSGLSGGARTLIIGGIAVIAVTISAFFYLAPSEPYVPVGPELPMEQVRAVRERLTTAGIPNQLDRRGTNVTVPEPRWAEAVVLLAAEGLPSRSGEGFESFKEGSFTATPFQNSVNYQRALQNELARVIGRIDSVAMASVLIARPDPTPFIRPEVTPTASVVLRLKPNATFSKAAASSVVSLVAHAVPGLKKENVTVVDSSGRMLSDPYAAHNDDLPGEMVEYRKGLEQYLAQKAQDVLTKSLGQGRAVVTVNTDLNYQKLKEKQKRLVPDEKGVSAERLQTMKTTAPVARGPAGVTSNAARPGGAANSSGGGGSQEERTDTDYIYSELIKETEDKAGAITRLTVAAVVDLSPATKPDGTPSDSQPLASPEDIQELIKTAIGFKVGRDEIKVANMRMTTPVAEIPPPDEETPRQLRIQTYMVLARNISLIVAAVVALAIIPFALLRTRRPAPPVETAPPPPPPTPEQLAAEARERRRQQLEKLAALTRSNPETVTDVFNILVSK